MSTQLLPKTRQTIARPSDNLVLDEEMDLDVIQDMVARKRNFDSKLREYKKTRNNAASEMNIKNKYQSQVQTLSSFIKVRQSVDKGQLGSLRRTTLNQASNESLPTIGTMKSKRPSVAVNPLPPMSLIF